MVPAPRQKKVSLRTEDVSERWRERIIKQQTRRMQSNQDKVQGLALIRIRKETNEIHSKIMTSPRMRMDKTFTREQTAMHRKGLRLDTIARAEKNLAEETKRVEEHIKLKGERSNALIEEREARRLEKLRRKHERERELEEQRKEKRELAAADRRSLSNFHSNQQSPHKRAGIKTIRSLAPSPQQLRELKAQQERYEAQKREESWRKYQKRMASQEALLEQRALSRVEERRKRRETEKERKEKWQESVKALETEHQQNCQNLIEKDLKAQETIERRAQAKKIAAMKTAERERLRHERAQRNIARVERQKQHKLKKLQQRLTQAEERIQQMQVTKDLVIKQKEELDRQAFKAAKKFREARLKINTHRNLQVVLRETMNIDIAAVMERRNSQSQ